MAMNGIGQADLYSKLNYSRVEEQFPAQKQHADAQERPVGERTNDEKPAGLSLSLNLDGIRARQNMNLDDAALRMQKSSGSSFEMKTLSYRPDPDEMDRAISDLQKDASLMQYTYYVGDPNVVVNDEDGVVIRK